MEGLVVGALIVAGGGRVRCQGGGDDVGAQVPLGREAAVIAAEVVAGTRDEGGEALHQDQALPPGRQTAQTLSSRLRLSSPQHSLSLAQSSSTF